MTAWLLRRLLLGLQAVLVSSAAFSAAPASAPVQLLELRGRVLLPEPYQRRVALVSLSSVTTPYIAQTRVFHKGRFKFGKLTPGPYTVTVRVRGQGEVRQTIEVGPSAADNRGRVYVELQLEGKPVARGVSAGSVVSLRQLSIPERAHGEYQKAMARLAKHDSFGALEHLEKAVALAPQYAEALNTLGTIYYRRREFSKAEAIFRRALEQSPESFEALVNLGGALITERRYQEALPFNQKAAQARPQEALAQSQLGWDYLYLNRDEEALVHFQEAKRLDPAHFSHPQLGLAEIYNRRLELARAADELDDFLRYHPDDPYVHRIRADIVRLRNAGKP